MITLDFNEIVDSGDDLVRFQRDRRQGAMISFDFSEIAGRGDDNCIEVAGKDDDSAESTRID